MSDGGKHMAHHLIVAVAGLALAAASARRIARVVDRDTVVTVSGTRVRLNDYNAPKIRGECPRKRDLAQRATALRQRLAGPGLKRSAGDRYGRTLEIAKAPAREDVAAALIQPGLAHPYPGRGPRGAGGVPGR
jgi:endonuclease YncB( thermonuclease family)